VGIEFKENEKNPTLKYLIFKVMKFVSKTIFNHLLLSSLLMKSFEDLNLISYMLVVNSTIKVILKRKKKKPI
jgi:hypothetical protein